MNGLRNLELLVLDRVAGVWRCPWDRSSPWKGEGQFVGILGTFFSIELPHEVPGPVLGLPSLRQAQQRTCLLTSLLPFPPTFRISPTSAPLPNFGLINSSLSYKSFTGSMRRLKNGAQSWSLCAHPTKTTHRFPNSCSFLSLECFARLFLAKKYSFKK
jgi:hypothetical protein